MDQFKNIPSIPSKILSMIKFLIMLPQLIYQRLTSLDKYKIDCVVSKITKSRKSNPLHSVVNWFIDTQITKNSLTKDKHEYYVDETINVNSPLPQIHKRINDDTCDNFTFNDPTTKMDYIIYYSYSEKTINIDGEKKEN